MQKVLWATLVGLSTVGMLGTDAAEAQVRPDATLGAESSRVRADRVRGRDNVERDSDIIEGGARRGGNLFHSFEQFDVPEGRGAYFDNPADVRNIFSRVTGNTRSEVFGTLGVLGDANLFFMNPNGILFGPNASLDVGGSFVGTTANGIQFGEQGFFNATNPESPALLTINPSAFLFNSSLVTPSSITVQGNGQGIRSTTTPIDTDFGLRVSGNQTFALIGGNLIFDGATVKTAGGRIELGSVTSGSVGLSPVADGWTFSYANVAAFQDIQLARRSVVDASGSGGGNLQVRGNQISLSGESQIEASTLGTESGGKLDVVANGSVDMRGLVTDSNYTGIYAQTYRGSTGAGNSVTLSGDNISLSGLARISTNTFGIGRGGDITIQANREVNVDGVGATTRIESDVSGASGVRRGGDLTITTPQLNVRRAQISSSVLNGNGQAGNLTIFAPESVTLSGEIPGSGSEVGFPGGLFAVVNNDASGRGGNLRIETGLLSISDGSKAQAISFGNGDSGNVFIVADRVEVFETALPNRFTTGIFVGAGFDPRQVELTQGGRGNLTIQANQLSIRGGEISASTQGQGDAGRVLIQARDSVEVIDTTAAAGNPSLIAAIVSREAKGRGGDVTIETNRLVVQGGRIAASTNGQGDAGDLTIHASDSVTLTGVSPALDGNRASAGGLFARVRPDASGDGGRVTITTRHLDINDGSQIQVTTFGNGNAGQLLIKADEINIRDTDQPNSSPTGILAGVKTEPQQVSIPVGNGGDITIRVNRLSINGGQISANTTGQGNAGGIQVQGANSITLDNGSISTVIDKRATATQPSNIDLQTDQLSLSNGAEITASTSGQGNAGNITVQDADRINLNDSTIASIVNNGATGEGGSITLNTDALNLSRSNITASTQGQGRAGNITVQGADRVSLNRSTISTEVGDTGIEQGGDIQVQTNRLNLRNRSNITSSTSSTGNTGSINVSATDRINLRNSRINNRVQRGATGNSRTIRLDSPALNLTNSQISAATNGNGSAGNVIISDANSIRLDNSIISTRIQNNGIVPRNPDQPDQPSQRGNIRLETRNLDLTNRSRIAADTANRGDAGNIRVQNAQQVTASDNSSISSTVQRGARGQGGSITLDTAALELENAQIAASTSGRGNAGNIQVQNADHISVNQGSISTAVDNRNSGRGGSISLETDGLDLNNAQITARTVSRRPAGSISLNATGDIAATDSQIETSSRRSSGGDIHLSADLVRLNNSDIQTTLESGSASGGNISVEAAAVIARGDSDIISAAPEGSGGNITLPLFFGQGYQSNLSEQADPASLDGNGRVDVSAAGQLSSGTIQTPDTSFIQNSLSDLPTSSINTDQLLANSCIARRSDGSSFLVTGSGSLPERPGNAQQSEYPTSEMRAIPQSESPDSQPGEPIIEPQGVYRLPDGRLIMSRECQQPL